MSEKKLKTNTDITNTKNNCKKAIIIYLMMISEFK